MNAYDDLIGYLEEGENVEAIVFGPWGSHWPPEEGEEWGPGFLEPDPPPVPFDKRGVILSLDEARPMMQDWSFYGGLGRGRCYAVRIYTSKRIIWVTQYDGSTTLDSTPVRPTPGYIPDMPGG